jgi:hypothetical protein
MKTYKVRVWEEDCGSFIFTGVEASNKNEACARSISDYILLVEETEIKGLNATAYLEI